MGRRFRDQISQVRPRLDSKYTSSTTPGQQIRVIGCRVAVPRSHWSAVPTLLFIYISQLLRDSFSVSQQPPIWEPPSHYSMPVNWSPWRGAGEAVSPLMMQQGMMCTVCIVTVSIVSIICQDQSPLESEEGLPPQHHTWSRYLNMCGMENQEYNTYWRPLYSKHHLHVCCLLTRQCVVCIGTAFLQYCAL